MGWREMVVKSKFQVEISKYKVSVYFGFGNSKFENVAEKVMWKGSNTDRTPVGLWIREY